jgi:hypothetical protein
MTCVAVHVEFGDHPGSAVLVDEGGGVAGGASKRGGDPVLPADLPILHQAIRRSRSALRWFYTLTSLRDHTCSTLPLTTGHSRDLASRARSLRDVRARGRAWAASRHDGGVGANSVPQSPPTTATHAECTLRSSPHVQA